MSYPNSSKVSLYFYLR